MDVLTKEIESIAGISRYYPVCHVVIWTQAADEENAVMRSVVRDMDNLASELLELSLFDWTIDKINCTALTKALRYVVWVFLKPGEGETNITSELLERFADVRWKMADE